MNNYRTVRTTTGRKYRMRIPEDEIHERRLYRAALVCLPFFGTVLLMAVWLTH
jgi:hypothetical protein